MVSGLPTTEKRGFESHQLGGNSGWHLWNHHRIFELKKPGNSIDAVGFWPTASILFCFYGAPAGIRTPDTLLKRQVLCLLSYWGIWELLPEAGHPFGARTGRRISVWLGWRDSNPLYRSQSPVCYHYTTSQYCGGSVIGRKRPALPASSFLYGVGYGARTHDTRNHNPVLCQLS